MRGKAFQLRTRDASNFFDNAHGANGRLRWNRNAEDVNGRGIVPSCSGGGSVFKGTVDMAAYNAFSNCMQTFAACNAIFYIKDGVIQNVSAIGTGGMRCYSNETMRPGFRGAANIQ